MNKTNRGISLNVLIITILIILTASIAILSTCIIINFAKKNAIESIEKAILILPEEQRETLSDELLNKILEEDITKEEKIQVEQILNIHGVDISSFNLTTNGSNYERVVILVNVILYIVIIIILAGYLYKEIGKYNKKVLDMTEYAKRIINGNYELCISDNEEGELSILKNRIYDMTVILREKNELLDTDKKELKKLMEDVSHQFKTPLTSLSLINELLYEEDSNLKKQEFLNNMRKELDKLQWLITTLLKLSQFDAKAIDLKKDNIEIKKLLEKSIATFSLLAEVKEVEINLKTNEQVILTCDISWTLEAINNIIKNSIEHGAKNIEISYKDNPLYTEIEIKDNGEGINKEDLPNIFNRFYRSKNRKSDSVGIGLALVKSIVESEHGEVRVKSKENEYTIFNLKFYKIK